MQTGSTDEDEIRKRAARQALGALTGLLPVGVVATDPEGIVWYQSQRWQDSCGVTDAEMLDRPWYEAVHPDDRQGLASRWLARIESRGRLGEFRVVGHDGVTRHCRAESVVMVGLDGKVDGHLVVVTHADLAVHELASPTLSAPYLVRAVLERSPDIITILNSDGSWRWSSGAAVRLLGHQEDFDPRGGVFGLVHPDDREFARKALSRVIADGPGAQERLEFRLRFADGTWRTMEALVDALLDDPAVSGIVIYLRDVSERRRVLDALAASERRLSNIIANFHTAMMLEDEHQTVVFANQAFVDLLHLPITPDDLAGRTLESHGINVERLIVDPPDVEQMVRAIRATRRPVRGVRFVLYDGRTVECDFLPVTVDGADRGFLFACRDVSDRARAEAEQERLLASEREENRRLAELDAYRSESIAAVSHELRTPLTSIVGYTQLLRSMLDPAASPDEVACIDAIVRNVDRLLRLAGDVVALDSLESRALPLPVAEVDIPEVLRRAVRTIGPEASAKGITVTLNVVDAGPPVRGDEDRLAQLFENLLSNAVKFTPDVGRVEVWAQAVATGWQVRVADSGIGIPEDELKLLFTRFFRASNARTRGFPGSGLGLSVARAIAQRHGGGITVTSGVGIGTTVTVEVGDAIAEDALSGSATAGPPSAGR